ncbi:MAG: glycosyltransferase, partial [Actinomycetota bacterium]|nr:glycosyltransferase [Actinomycetota bacterium]
MVGNPRSPHLQVYWRYMRDAGHEVDILSGGESPVPGMRVVNIEPRRHYNLPFGVFTLLARLHLTRRALTTGDYDVVSLQYISTHAVMASLSWQGPLHVSFWGSDIHLLSRQPRHVRWAMPWLLRRADAIQSVSNFMTAELVKLGARSDRIDTFQYGVDLGVFAPVAGRASRDPNLIVSTRALRPLYRLDALMRSFAVLSEDCPNARLVIAGDGPERTRLENLAVELGVQSSVEFTGQLIPVDLARLLSSAAV